MGWDAYAVGPKGGRVRSTADFKSAANAVRQVVGSVDGLLERGGLACSPCAYAIEEVSNKSAWRDWSADEVKSLWQTWQTIDPEYVENPWAYYSARAFIKVCAENGYGFEASF